MPNFTHPQIIVSLGSLFIICCLTAILLVPFMQMSKTQTRRATMALLSAISFFAAANNLILAMFSTTGTCVLALAVTFSLTLLCWSFQRPCERKIMAR